MQKIPTLFKRNPDDMKHVVPEVTPGCEWVVEGRGTATRKFDGTCVMLDEAGRWWGRREVKPGKQPPDNFQPIEYDENTGKTVGWEPIEQTPFFKYHQEALVNPVYEFLRDAPTPGTYELCGPKINKNPDRFDPHILVRHDDTPLVTVPIRPGDPVGTFRDLRETLTGKGFEGKEGIVWHHPDGRMAKLKVRDFS